MRTEQERNRPLISIDLPKRKGSFNSDGKFDNAHVKRPEDTGHLVPAQLRAIWDLRLGDSLDLVPAAMREGPEMFFHDGAHDYLHMHAEYEAAWESMPNGILASDDITWSPAWAEILEKNKGGYVDLGGYDALRAIWKGIPSEMWRRLYPGNGHR